MPYLTKDGVNEYFTPFFVSIALFQQSHCTVSPNSLSNQIVTYRRLHDFYWSSSAIPCKIRKPLFDDNKLLTFVCFDSGHRQFGYKQINVRG